MSNSFSNYDTHENKSASKEKKIKNEIKEIEKEIKKAKSTVEIKTENTTVNTPTISLVEIMMVMGIGLGLVAASLNLFTNAKEKHEMNQNKIIENEIALEEEYTDN